MQTESRQEKHLGGGTKTNAIPPSESWKQQKGTAKVAKVGKPEVARVSRRALSPFVCLARGHRISRATYRCSMSLQHGQRCRRRCRSSCSGGANTRAFNEIAPGMWGVVTQARPAPQLKPLKTNALSSDTEPPENREIARICEILRHFATFYKGTLYMKWVPPCCFNDS